jgi:N-acyl homoserine lactone hydrolase
VNVPQALSKTEQLRTRISDTNAPSASFPVRLYVLPLGEVDIEPEQQGPDYPGPVPVPGFLIQLNDGTNILVDTGLPLHDTPDPYRLPPFVPRATADDDIRHRLAEVGVAVADVSIVVCTHLDLDHCGGHRHFPHARFVIQQEHYAYALEHPERFPADDFDRPELHYQQVNGPRTIAPGVSVLPTPGHVPGHQSVIVRGLPATGTVVLTGDAAATRRELEEEPRYGIPEDEQRIASIRALKRIRDHEHATLLVSHDPGEWTHYKLSPAYYD